MRRWAAAGWAVLTALAMDRLSSNPAALNLMQAKGPSRRAKLKALKAESVKFEDPARQISLEFN